MVGFVRNKTRGGRHHCLCLPPLVGTFFNEGSGSNAGERIVPDQVEKLRARL